MLRIVEIFKLPLLFAHQSPYAASVLRMENTQAHTVSKRETMILVPGVLSEK